MTYFHTDVKRATRRSRFETLKRKEVVSRRGGGSFHFPPYVQKTFFPRNRLLLPKSVEISFRTCVWRCNTNQISINIVRHDLKCLGLANLFIDMSSLWQPPLPAQPFDHLASSVSDVRGALSRIKSVVGRTERNCRSRCKWRRPTGGGRREGGRDRLFSKDV